MISDSRAWNCSPNQTKTCRRRDPCPSRQDCNDSEFISYGFAGKSGLIRYLDIYPATEGYANLPCWGYGDIVESNHLDISVGDRIYGFLPIASHIKMIPGDVSQVDLLIPVNAGLLCHRFITNTPSPKPSQAMRRSLKRRSCSSGLYLARHS